MKILSATLESCGVNYQTEYLIEEINLNFECTKDLKEADTIIMLGGCCCTDVQLNDSLIFINWILENKKSSAVTYLTGCITRTFKDIPKLQEIERWLNNNIDYILNYYEPNILLKHLSQQNFSDLPDRYGICMYNKYRAHIFIQNGCTHNCSFCKTNYLNCYLKDAPIEKVKDYIDDFDEKRGKKIELRGLNLSQYGLDLYKEYKLMEVCEYVEEKKNIKEVILSSFAFSDAIRANFSEKLKYLTKTFCINGSLESGSDRLLKLMNKGFTKEEFLSFYNEVNSIYKKQFILNIISGFPTETIDDCLETIEVLKYVKPGLVNINTYIDSTFVPAHNLQQLSSEEIKEHTKFYSKQLKKNHIKYKINGAN